MEESDFHLELIGWDPDKRYAEERRRVTKHITAVGCGKGFSYGQAQYVNQSLQINATKLTRCKGNLDQAPLPRLWFTYNCAFYDGGVGEESSKTLCASTSFF